MTHFKCNGVLINYHHIGSSRDKSIDLNRWTVGASIEKLRKWWRTVSRAPSPGTCCAVARGRSDLGPNILFKWLRILPIVMTVCFLSFDCRRFPVLTRDCSSLLSSSLLLTAYKKRDEGSSRYARYLSHELQTTHPRPIFSEHRESGRAGLRNHRS
jgi:hypothetical protein